MEQRNNLVLHGTETFSRGALGQCGAGKRRGGAGFLRRPLPALRQLYHPGVRHAGLLQPECQLERQRPPQHHGRSALPGLCREHLDRLAQLWQVGTGLPPLQHQSPERGRLVFLMGDTVTVATPGGGTGIQLQVNLSTNDDKQPRLSGCWPPPCAPLPGRSTTATR